jgi:uncharacterized protein YbjT (DUF2867 family)
VILIVGGTGVLGRQLLPRLVARKEPVRVLSRRPAPNAVVADLRDPDALARAVANARVIVSAASGFGPAGAGPRAVDLVGGANLIGAAERAGVERFIQVSAYGARADHPLELFRCKHEVEARLRQTRLAWTIVRPTAFMQTWMEIVGAPLLKGGRATLFGRAHNPINFVSAEDVAVAVVAGLDDPTLASAILEVGGPEDFSLTAFAERFAATSGVGCAIRRVPRLALWAASILAAPIHPPFARMARAALVMDTADMSFNPDLRRTLLVEPTPFEAAVRRVLAADDLRGN